MMSAYRVLTRWWTVFALAASLSLLAAAHAFERFGGLAPCNLCLKQREVYWVAVAIALTATDNLSPLRSVHYAIDSADDWQPAMPDDLIYDSTREQVAVIIADLEPGPHVVTLRVVDGRGNALYKAQIVQIP